MSFKALPAIIAEYIRYRLTPDKEAGNLILKVSGSFLFLFISSLYAVVFIFVLRLIFFYLLGIDEDDTAVESFSRLLVGLQITGFIPLFFIFLPLYFYNVAHHRLYARTLYMPLRVSGIILTILFSMAEDGSSLQNVALFIYIYLGVTGAIFVHTMLGKKLIRKKYAKNNEDQTTFEYQQKQAEEELKEKIHADALEKFNKNMTVFKKDALHARWKNFCFNATMYLSMIAVFSVVCMCSAVISFAGHLYYKCYVLLAAQCGPQEGFIVNVFLNPYYGAFNMTGLFVSACLCAIFLLPYYGMTCFLWARNHKRSLYFMLAAAFNFFLLSGITITADAEDDVLIPMLSLLFISPLCGALHLWVLNKIHQRWPLVVPDYPKKPVFEEITD